MTDPTSPNPVGPRSLVLETGATNGPTAVLDPAAGGRLASLVVDGRERLVGRPAPADLSVHWGSFLMAPWVGRMAGATLEWEGHRHRFPANDGPHALHGLVFQRPWTVVVAEPSLVRLEIGLGQAGWPFGGLVRHELRLEPDRLELRAEVEAGDRAMPAALGWHPWFARPPRRDMAIKLISAEFLETAPDLIPTGRRLPVHGPTDLRSGPLLGDRRLDHTFVDVHPPATITWPDLRFDIEFGAPLGTAVVHTPPAGVCVEPQTSWPDAAALDGRGVAGTGLVRLAAGETLRATTIWRWSSTGQEAT